MFECNNFLFPILECFSAILCAKSFFFLLKLKQNTKNNLVENELKCLISQIKIIVEFSS